MPTTEEITVQIRPSNQLAGHQRVIEVPGELDAGQLDLVDRWWTLTRQIEDEIGELVVRSAS